MLFVTPRMDGELLLQDGERFSHCLCVEMSFSRASCWRMMHLLVTQLQAAGTLTATEAHSHAEHMPA